MHRTLLAAAVLATASPAMAQIIESEPNNTPALPDFLGTFNAPDGVTAQGTITPGNIATDLPGDVDLFQFTVNFNAYLLVTVFGLPDSSSGDAQVALLTGAGVLAADDNSGIDGFPALQYTLAPGTYFLGVTGANDLGFPGPLTFPDGRNPNQSPHLENFAYKMVVGLSLVPSPSAAALLGLGGVMAARRRR